MPQGEQFDLPPHIAAIILAAGSSRRMRTSKALLPIDGEPMVRRIVRMFLDSAVVHDIVIVTGHAANNVKAAVESLPCRFAFNPRYAKEEMLASVKVGLAAMKGADAAFIALVDHPRVKPATIAEIVSHLEPDNPSIVVPRYRGKRGHPVLIPRHVWPRVLALAPAATMKEVTRNQEEGIIQIDMDDPAVVTDLDTPEDYERELQKE